MTQMRYYLLCSYAIFTDHDYLVSTSLEREIYMIYDHIS